MHIIYFIRQVRAKHSLLDYTRKPFIDADNLKKLPNMNEKFDALINELKFGFSYLDNKIDEIDSKITDTDIKVSTIDKKIDYLENSLKSNKRITAHIASGLGIHFEKFNLAWLKHLYAKVYPEFEPILRRKEKDFDHIVSEDDIVEIDLFCFNPLIIGEVTTFLDEDEFGKIEKFVRTKQFIQKLYKEEPKAYLFAYHIDSKSKADVEKLCNENDIQIIQSV